MTEKRKIFITVKTYPTLLKKYDELVCTAGILDDGSWARIYPLPFRKLDYENRYRKYQWIELPLQKIQAIPDRETYKVVDISQIKLIGKPINTKGNWQERKRIIFKHNQVYTDLSDLIELANRNELSLAIFKPKKIIEFVAKETEHEWRKDKLELLKKKAKQLSLFQTEEEMKREFLVVKKLPYKFFYRFSDAKGKEAILMIEDWKIGALYSNRLKQTEGNESIALVKVKEKFYSIFHKKDIYSLAQQNNFMEG